MGEEAGVGEENNESVYSVGAAAAAWGQLEGWFVPSGGRPQRNLGVFGWVQDDGGAWGAGSGGGKREIRFGEEGR